MEEPKVLSITTEEMETFAVKAIDKAKEGFDESLDEKLDEKFETFKESMVPAKKETEDPNEVFGKLIQYQWAKQKNSTLLKTLDPQDEATAADGGTLVPTITRAEIVRLIEVFGDARRSFRQMPMGKANVITLPGKLTGATVTRVSENTAITDTKVTLTTYTLTAQKVAAIVAFSSELLEDNIVDMASYVNELLAEAFGTEEDDQMFAGTGSPHTGLFNASSTYGNTISVAAHADITYKNLVDVTVGIKQSYLRGASWKMNRAVYGSIAKILDSNGNPIVVNPGEVRRTLFEYPIQLIESAPTVGAGMPVLVLGNTNQNSFMGIKREMTATVLTEATIDGVSLAANDLVGLRVTKRDAFSVGQVLGYSAISINA